MGRECFIGFQDLFLLAEGRPWSPEEERRFAELDQPSRNAKVKELAARAGNIRTEDRMGTDGLVYTAFWVEGPARFEELLDRWSVPVPVAGASLPDGPGLWVVTPDDEPILLPGNAIDAGGGESLSGSFGELQPPPGTYLRWVEGTGPAGRVPDLRGFLGLEP